MRVDRAVLDGQLDQLRRRQFALIGAFSVASPGQRLDSTVVNLTDSAVESSRIEGEHLNAEAVRSSVARRLGVESTNTYTDARTEGVVDMTLDATRNFDGDLTFERLGRWHSGLFPIVRGDRRRRWIGTYRDAGDGPMQIVSGPSGRERIHYEAPPAELVPSMMDEFLSRFNSSRTTENGLIRSALSHLWFEAIHPFVDGNGRIGRAIADMALAQDENSSDRFYSLSNQIAQERTDYYDALEAAQHASLDVTPWTSWFLSTLDRAIGAAELATARARRATKFWDKHQGDTFNSRQRQVLWRILGDFEGDLNLRKYMAIARAPRATAQRDLAQLVEGGVVQAIGQGKATRYAVLD
jgi:Fic family protein